MASRSVKLAICSSVGAARQLNSALGKGAEKTAFTDTPLRAHNKKVNCALFIIHTNRGFYHHDVFPGEQSEQKG
jgi:hypothetical protein